MRIDLSEHAAREFRRIASEHGLPSDTCMRLAVQAGGCSGFTYVVDFASRLRDTDLSCRSQGVTIVADPRSALYLDGMTIGFRDEVIHHGFVFDNPNARSTCRCGLSFGI